MSIANMDALLTAINKGLRACRTTEHLACLDGYASAASGKPTRVYVSDDLDGALGQATWSPYYRCHCVWLHRSLMPGEWRQDQLKRVLLHECGHIAAGHISIKAKGDPFGLPRKSQPDNSRIAQIGQVLLAQREAEADAYAASIRSNDWRIDAYSLFALLQGKEVFPWPSVT